MEMEGGGGGLAFWPRGSLKSAGQHSQAMLSLRTHSIQTTPQPPRGQLCYIVHIEPSYFPTSLDVVDTQRATDEDVNPKVVGLNSHFYIAPFSALGSLSGVPQEFRLCRDAPLAFPSQMSPVILYLGLNPSVMCR